MRRGDFVPLKARDGTLSYLRTTKEQSVLVAVNFKRRAMSFTLPEGKWQMLLTSDGDSTDAAAALAPYEVRLLVSEK